METKDEAMAFLKGYEEGLREAWSDFINLTSRSYRSKEIQILAKMHIQNKIPKKIEKKRHELERILNIALEEKPHETEWVRSEIVPGRAYLVKETSPPKIFNIYSELLDEETIGLCIHRTEPDKLIRKYGIKGKIIWLSKTEMLPSIQEDFTCADLSVVSPTSLETLSTTIIEFLKQEGRKVIMMGGLDFLLTHNDFQKVMKFLQSIKDRIFYSKAIMLVAYDPEILEVKNRKILEKEIEEKL